MNYSRWCAVVVAAAVTLLHVPVSQAADAGAVSRSTELGWLTSRDYASLDRHYSRLQQDYEAGKASEVQLFDAYRALYESRLANARYFDEWVHAYPASYAALTARGAFYYRMAWNVRGQDFTADTPDKQLDAMARYVDKARPDLLASMKLTRKPYISALYLLNTDQLNGRAEDQRHWLDVGNKLDANNYLLRRRYMVTLQPRWGGSYEQMHDFLEESRRDHAPANVLYLLEASIYNDQAEVMMRQGDSTHANEVLRAELDLLNKVDALPTETEWMNYEQAAWILHRYDEARKALEHLDQADDAPGWVFSRLGWIYVQNHDIKDAWGVLNKGATLNDSWAQMVVGKTLYQGCAEINVPADKQAGLAWLRKAADQNDAEAKAFLQQHGA